MNHVTFRDLNLGDSLLQTLARQEFETPTPIQAEAIPEVLAGRDILASAQTGSGKTAAFALPILQLLASDNRRPERGRPKVLILAPTRELAGQIRDVLSIFSRNLRLSSAVIYGGVGKYEQINALRRGVDIVVATPGRLLDLMGEGHLTLDHVKKIVLDEADRMLDMGFIPDVERIIQRLPSERQSLFFSATLPPAVVKLANELLTDPVRISVESKEEDKPRIDQHVMFVNQDRKRDALRMILTERGSFRALVFTRTKHRARDLSRYLSKNGIACDDLHGDKSQSARSKALLNFHRGTIQVLVATDIASRGIDIDDIDHVINYELPHEASSYTHRIGRTARAGKAGTALSLCDGSELDNLSTIQRALEHAIPVLSDHPFHATDVAEAALQFGRRSGRGGSARPRHTQGPRPGSFSRNSREGDRGRNDGGSYSGERHQSGGYQQRQGGRGFSGGQGPRGGSRRFGRGTK